MPEHLEDDKAQLDGIRKALDLPATFNIRGYENVSCTCSDCNGKKGASILPANLLAINLATARMRATRVSYLVAQHGSRTKLEIMKYHRMMLRRSITDLAKGEGSTMAEVSMLSNINKEYVEAIASMTLDDFLSKSTEELEQAELFQGDTIDMLSEAGEMERVKSFSEYKAALQRGFSPGSLVAIKAASGIVEPFGALIELVKSTQFPERSFIETPRCGVTSLRLLPGSMTSTPQDAITDATIVTEGESVQDLVNRGAATIHSVDAASVCFLFNGFYHSLHELVRADVDGDGVEDILAVMNVNADGGSLGWSELVLLKRTSSEGMFVVEKFDPLAAIRPARPS